MINRTWSVEAADLVRARDVGRPYPMIDIPYVRMYLRLDSLKILCTGLARPVHRVVFRSRAFAEVPLIALTAIRAQLYTDALDASEPGPPEALSCPGRRGGSLCGLPSRHRMLREVMMALRFDLEDAAQHVSNRGRLHG